MAFCLLRRVGADSQGNRQGRQRRAGDRRDGSGAGDEERRGDRPRRKLHPEALGRPAAAVLLHRNEDAERGRQGQECRQRYS